MIVIAVKAPLFLVAVHTIVGGSEIKREMFRWLGL